MYPIAVCSIFIFAIAIERIQYLYFKASISKDAFIQAMRKYILAGNVGKALALCSQSGVDATFKVNGNRILLTRTWNNRWNG